MNADELKIQNPELYQAVFGLGRSEGLEAGRSEGATAERARLSALDKLAIHGAADLIAAAKNDPTKSLESVAVEILTRQTKAFSDAGIAIAADKTALGEQMARVGNDTPGFFAQAGKEAKSLSDKINIARR